MRTTKNIHSIAVIIMALVSILPLQLLIFGDEVVILQGQLAGIMYIMILIAFLCGIQWSQAVHRKITLIHFTSPFLAITPWFLILARRFFNEEVLWAVMGLEMIIILAIDWICFKRYHPQWYFMLKNIITCLLCICIAIVCIRKSLIA